MFPTRFNITQFISLPHYVLYPYITITSNLFLSITA